MPTLRERFTDSLLTIIVRRDDLQLILGGLDEYWETLPEYKPAIERLQRAVSDITIATMALMMVNKEEDANS